MKRLLVFQHVPYELLGTLDPLLKSAGFRIRYLNFGRTPDAIPRTDRYDGLIVLGGPMNVDQTDKHPHLATEIDALRTAIERGIPVLGICLGAQLIARALGARVHKNPVTEIGWYDVTPTDAGTADPLLAKFNGTEKIFQWHGDTFDIPKGAVNLASSPDCANQAFRYGETVYGLQFHLEVDAPLVERWLRTPGHAEEIRRLEPASSPERISRDTTRHIARSLELGDAVFREFIELYRTRHRRVSLPSR